MATTPAATRRSAPLPRRQRTGLVALAVPDLEEPYFAELTALLVRRADARGVSILIQQTEGDHDREVNIANGIGLPPIDGLIHIPRSLTVGDLTRRTSPGPLVLVGEHIEASPFTHITIDNRAAAYDATAHLAAAGCRRIAYIGPRNTHPSDAADRRYTGYQDALAALGLDPDGALVAQVDSFTSGEGLRAMRTLVGLGVSLDGVVCANDSVAFGVLAALHDAGLRVPANVAVIGIDDVRAARTSVPALTSVAPDNDAIVETALSELERQITTPPGVDLPVRHVIVKATIIPRTSTAR